MKPTNPKGPWDCWPDPRAGEEARIAHNKRWNDEVPPATFDPGSLGLDPVKNAAAWRIIEKYGYRPPVRLLPAEEFSPKKISDYPAGRRFAAQDAARVELLTKKGIPPTFVMEPLDGRLMFNSGQFARRLTLDDFLEALHNENPSDAALGALTIIAQQTTGEEITTGFMHNLYSWKELVSTFHRFGHHTPANARAINRWAASKLRGLQR